MAMAKGIALNEAFFVEVLKNGLNEETVEILEVTNDYLSTKGTNFLSDLYKASVRYTVSSKNGKYKHEGRANMVIKTEPLIADDIMPIVHEQQIFRTEIIMLRDVIPRIEKLVGSQIGPKLLHANESIPTYIVMEDLTRSGFIMKDRQQGLSFDHCVLVLKKLAKLHAGSVAVLEEDPELIKSFRGGILSPKCPASFIRLMEVSFSKMAQEISNWKEEKYTRIASKLNKLVERTNQCCKEIYACNDNDFCVLNHGDCWVNNIMFREDQQGQPIDVRLVDYQMSIYTSPAIDLLYFMNICPMHDIKYDKDDYFLEIYLTTLSDTMKKMGCKAKPPTIEKLKKSMYEKRFYAVFSAIVLYMRMIAYNEDTEDFGEVLIKMGGETRMDVFKYPLAKKVARKILSVLDERGYFE